MKMKFRIEQTRDDPEVSTTWALTEFFYWDKDVILRRLGFPKPGWINDEKNETTKFYCHSPCS